MSTRQKREAAHMPETAGRLPRRVRTLCGLRVKRLKIAQGQETPTCEMCLSRAARDVERVLAVGPLHWEPQTLPQTTHQLDALSYAMRSKFFK